MKMKKIFAALLTGILVTGLMVGCGDEKKPATPKTVVKLNLPFEKVKMKQGKEIELAKVNNVNKLSITKIFDNPGAMVKIGDKIYIRNAVTKNIVEAKLEGNDLKVIKPDFVKNIPEKSFLSTDGSKLYYGDNKMTICAADANGNSSVVYNRFVYGLVNVPKKNAAMTFSSSSAIKMMDLSTGKLGQEISVVIPEKRDNLLRTPNGLACDGTNAYLFGSTLDGKMSVGAVAVYGLDGKQKYVLGNKHDKERKPGYLASAGDIAVTDDYIYVYDKNIRQINIFTKKDGKIVDLISADTLYNGQRGINLMPYVGNNVLAIVKSTKKDEPDKVFMMNM